MRYQITYDVTYVVQAAVHKNAMRPKTVKFRVSRARLISAKDTVNIQPDWVVSVFISIVLFCAVGIHPDLRDIS